AWSAFTAVQADAGDAPPVPPPAHEAPYSLRSPYRRTILSSLTPERRVLGAAPIAAAALICLTLFFVGRAMDLESRTADLQRQTAAMGSAAANGSTLQRRVRELATLKEAAQRPDAVVLLQAAQAVVDPFKVKLTGFSDDGEHVRLVLPPEAVPQVGDIA